MNISIGTNTYTTVVPEIASEIFDGELVIANYKLGFYYSISAEGSWIWQGLAHGLTVSQIVQWLSGQFESQADELPILTEDFIEKLIAEGLVLPAPKMGNSTAELPALTGDIFSQPTIERFDDLQELLLLDPVHDVDLEGWPRRPE
jgi:hypothetical protein